MQALVIALSTPHILPNVREKHQLAAARWAGLADLAERASAAQLSRLSVRTAGGGPGLSG